MEERVKIEDSLTADQRQDIVQIIHTFCDVFREELR